MGMNPEEIAFQILVHRFTYVNLSLSGTHEQIIGQVVGDTGAKASEADVEAFFQKLRLAQEGVSPLH